MVRTYLVSLKGIDTTPTGDKIQDEKYEKHPENKIMKATCIFKEKANKRTIVLPFSWLVCHFGLFSTTNWDTVENVSFSNLHAYT